MNGNAALNLIMGRLGNRTQQSLRDNVLLEMQLAQDGCKERIGILPWFLFLDYTAASFVTVPSQEYVDLPTDFLELDDEHRAGAGVRACTATPARGCRRRGRR